MSAHEAENLPALVVRPGLSVNGPGTYRILVTSSRTCSARSVLDGALDDAERRAYAAGYRSVTVVHGGARGGDRMADDWTWLPSLLPGMTRWPSLTP